MALVEQKGLRVWNSTELTPIVSSENAFQGPGPGLGNLVMFELFFL